MGGNCGVVDFSKPGVADWWGAYQQKPLDDGVMGFWTDMGEPAWSNEESTDRLNMEHYLGMHDELHNVYGSIWDMAVTEQFEKRNPDRRIFQMTRSAFAGLQRYTFGWTGDAGNGSNMDAGWKQLENQIAIMLSSGLGGCVFSATDISGYCGKIENYPAMAELYIRWLQFGMFNTISRIHHEGDVAVEPWLFGEKAERIARKAIELKYRLIPYIYTYAREAYETGLPVLRPMFLEYPDDPETMEIESQFMFGENMLVAPVVRKGSSKKKVYLPVGNWIDYNTFEEYEGETWIDYQVSLDITPIFVKKGCIIPTHPVMNYVDEKENAPVIFEIYPEENDVECKFNLYEDDGISLGYKRNEFSRTMISAKWNDKKGIIRVHARESYLYTPVEERNFIFSILKSKKPKSISVDGKKLSKKEWNFNSVSGRCTVTIKDIGKQQDIELIY